MHLELDYGLILKCFNEYMAFAVGKPPTLKEFVLNMELKENDPNFTGDMEALLRQEIEYDQETAFEWLKTSFLS